MTKTAVSMFNINFMEKFFIKLSFSFSIFHIINLAMICQIIFFLCSLFYSNISFYTAKHQFNAQNTIFIKFSRKQNFLKTLVWRLVAHRVTSVAWQISSATPVYTMINTILPLVESRACRDVRAKLCNNLFTCALCYALSIKCSPSIEIKV